MGILGIHHVGLVSSDLERSHEHYVDILGLRPLQHLDGAVWFGTETAGPGGLLGIVEQRGAEPGREGVGGTHHFALLVETREDLRRWKRWLTDHDIAVNGPLDRHYFESIYHRDPDGQVIEIATRGPGWTRDENPDAIGSEHRPPPPAMLKGNRDRERIRADTWPEPVTGIDDGMRIARMHHITAIGDDIEATHRFLAGLLGMRRVKRTSNFDMPDSFHWYWGIGDGAPGTVVTYFERKGAAPVRRGPGQVAYYALAVADDDALVDVHRRLRDAGSVVADIEEGGHWKAFHTLDPHGQTVVIATRGSGFDTAGKGTP